MPDIKPNIETQFSYNTDYVKLKPEGLVISDIKWKYLLRSVIKGKNIMMLGPTGTAKCLGESTKVDLIVSDEIYQKILSNRTEI